jgi:uncharacterized protein YjdB
MEDQTMNRIIGVAFLVALAACSEATAPKPLDTAAVIPTDTAPKFKRTVKITAPTTDLRTGTKLMLTASVEEVPVSANRTVAAVKISWKSSNPARATIDNSGQLKVYAPGPVTFTAEADGATSGTLTLNAILDVVPVREFLQLVSFSTGDTVAVGTVLQATPLLKDTTGAVVALTDKFITWGSTNPQVATVNDSGVVTARGTGFACITAIINGMGRCRGVRVTGTANTAAVASVVVTAPTDTMTVGDLTRSMSAIFKDANGVAVEAPISWGAHNELTIKINALGQLVALRAGQSTISATANGVTKQLLVYAKP